MRPAERTMPWILLQPSGRRDRQPRIGPAELLVRGSIDFVAELESRNVRSGAFDDSGKLGTENQGQALEFDLALTDESVPMTHPCRLDADQQLPSPGFRRRQVVVCDHVWWTES